METLNAVRLLLQAVSAVLAAGLLFLALVLFARKPHFRAYLMPVIALLLHMITFATAQIMRDMFGTAMPINLTDWSALQRFHVLITLAIYIMWMPALRR